MEQSHKVHGCHDQTSFYGLQKVDQRLYIVVKSNGSRTPLYTACIKPTRQPLPIGALNLQDINFRFENAIVLLHARS